jgi:hypothetical protein
MMNRVVEPEWLDTLSQEDPRAIASRRDLRLINGLMGNLRWMRKRFLSKIRPQDHVVELGAGDGALGKSLSWSGDYCGMDLAAMPSVWPEHYDWHQGDCLAATATSRLREASVVVGNLVLHHFSDAQLQTLGTRFEQARLLCFCEPARRSRHLWQGKALGLFGINEVTRHDLPISVRAGFLADELPRALGLGSEWQITVQLTWLGAYRFFAERRLEDHA